MFYFLLLNITDSETENVDTSSQPENVQDPSVTSYYEAQQPMSNGNAHLEERPESPVEKVVPEPEKPEEPESSSENMFETKPVEKTPEPEPEPQPSSKFFVKGTYYIVSRSSIST